MKPGRFSTKPGRFRFMLVYFVDDGNQPECLYIKNRILSKNFLSSTTKAKVLTHKRQMSASTTHLKKGVLTGEVVEQVHEQLLCATWLTEQIKEWHNERVTLETCITTHTRTANMASNNIFVL